jgi:uncharacterized protein (DUF305 family)
MISPKLVAVRRRLVRVLALTALLGSLAVPNADARSVSAQDPALGGGTTTRHDVAFIAGMVPHHETAIALAGIAKKRAGSDEVRALAAHIVSEQSGQVARMQHWLRRHSASPTPPPAPVRELERQDLKILKMGHGRHVDMMFLMMMRPHHAQAVVEAQDEVRFGRDTFARRTAVTIRSGQLKEISRMNSLLASVPMPMPMPRPPT